jgi:hypothetical protein
MEYLSSKSIADTSNEDIVARCQNGLRLSSDTNSAKVVKILPDIAVKFGVGIGQNEATTLDYVCRHISRDSLRVPQIYRFFTHGEHLGMPVGYIVMEFIAGVTLEECDIGPDLIKRIVNALDHLSTIPMPPSQGPGPVYGGIPRGCLWSEYGAGEPFTSLQDMESWLNQRLDLSRRQLPQFALGSTKLFFSHMDIARRNIILTAEDELCFVDWAYAGFYPGCFQRFCIEWCSVDDASFIRDLLQELPGSYSNGEEYLLGEVCRINSMYPPPAISHVR